MPTTPQYADQTAFDSAIDGGAGINDARGAASITAGEVNTLLKALFGSFDVAIDKSDAASAGVAIQVNAARDGLELVPATRRLPDVPTGQNARGILKSRDGAAPEYADVAADDLSSEIREELVNALALTVESGQIRIVLTDGQGGTTRDETAALPTADTSTAGIIQISGDITEGTTDDTLAITARILNERLDGRILSGDLDSSRAGQVLEVDSQGHVTTGAKGTGPKGNDGDVGPPGADSAVYGTRYYQTTNSDTPPAAPTSDSDANWSTNLTAPSATARYAWQAIGVGTAPLATFADVDEWLILPASIFVPTSGGTTPAAQDHAIYLAYAPTGGSYTFTGADATAAGRSVNNRADETVTNLTLPSIPAGQYREVGIYLPTNKRIARLEIGNNNHDVSGGFTLATNPVTVPPSTQYVVYESNQPQSNPSPNTPANREYRITTRDA